MQCGILCWHKHCSACFGSPQSPEALITLIWAPLLSTQKHRETGWFHGVPLVRFPSSKHESWGRWTRHGKPRIYNSTFSPIKLALLGHWLLAPGHSHFHPLLHAWRLWKTSKQQPCFIPHAWSSLHSQTPCQILIPLYCDYYSSMQYNLVDQSRLTPGTLSPQGEFDQILKHKWMSRLTQLSTMMRTLKLAFSQ